MKPFNLRLFKPFECELLPNGILVHFGTVISESLNSLSTVIVPSASNGQIKRAGEKDFIKNNTIEAEQEGILYLDISLSNDFYYEKLQKWRDCFYNKNTTAMEEYLDINFPAETVEDYIDEQFGRFLLSRSFSPLVNLSPQVSFVEIKFFETNISEAEDLDSFNFIVDNKKRVAIATLSEDRKLTQIISSDYFFSFPSIWNVESSDFFLEPKNDD